MPSTRTVEHPPKKKVFCHWFPHPTHFLSHIVIKQKRRMNIKHSDPKFKKQKSLLRELSNLESSNSGLRLHPPTLDKTELVKIEKGGHLDVVSFLSNYGKTTHLVSSNGDTVQIDLVRKKYLLICCLKLPFDCFSFNSWVCRSLIDAYTELPRHRFEIVLVADMESAFHLMEGVFDYFFSAFKCLAVPFCDFDTRHFICSSIGFSNAIGTILVGPEGDIVQHQDAAQHFYSYGAELFYGYGDGLDPFTDSLVEFLDTQDDILRIRLDPFYPKREIVSTPAEEALSRRPLPPPSLFADILLCDPLLFLERIDSAGGPPMTVLELCNKHIGLYLCCDGDFMENLNVVHKRCLAMKQELEIVLVCLPIFDDPIAFQRDLFEALKLFNITSWFIFPFKDNRKVCRRLWRLFVQYMMHDKLVILPPCNSSQHGEIEARAILDQFGIDVYPFTASQIIQQRYNALKSFNPVSWFTDSRHKKRTCLIRNSNDSYVPKSYLDGKKLLLYLDWFKFDDDLCRLLWAHYPEIKASGCEVVFVPLDSKYVPIRNPKQHAGIAEMPWLMMPVEDAAKASVIAQLIVQGDDDKDGLTSRLIAVGEEGKILSKRAHVKLMEQGVTESLFADTLHQELVDDLTLLNPHVYYSHYYQV